MRSHALSKKNIGDAGENRAAAHLQMAGLQLLERNYRTPGRGGGEIDLIMRDRDGTLVFVEVHQRASSAYGGAAASITASKQQRIILAARHYLLRLGPTSPPCRFDVVCIEARSGEPSAPAALQWFKAAFDAG